MGPLIYVLLAGGALGLFALTRRDSGSGGSSAQPQGTDGQTTRPANPEQREKLRQKAKEVRREGKDATSLDSVKRRMSQNPLLVEAYAFQDSVHPMTGETYGSQKWFIVYIDDSGQVRLVSAPRDDDPLRQNEFQRFKENMAQKIKSEGKRADNYGYAQIRVRTSSALEYAYIWQGSTHPLTQKKYTDPKWFVVYFDSDDTIRSVSRAMSSDPSAKAATSTDTSDRLAQIARAPSYRPTFPAMQCFRGDMTLMKRDLRRLKEEGLLEAFADRYLVQEGLEIWLMSDETELIDGLDGYPCERQLRRSDFYK